MSFLLDEHSLTYSGLKSKHFFGIASHSKISYFETGAAGEQCPYKELAGCALVAGGTSALVGGGEGFPNGLAPTIPTMTHTCSHQQWIFGSRLAHYIPTPICCSSSWKVDSWTLFLELIDLVNQSWAWQVRTVKSESKWITRAAWWPLWKCQEWLFLMKQRWVYWSRLV